MHAAMSAKRFFSLIHNKLNLPSFERNCSFRNRFSCVNFFCTTQQPCPSVRYSVEMEQDVDKALTSGEIKHRKHPGRRSKTPISIPPKLYKAVEDILSDVDLRALLKEAEVFSKQFLTRKLPIETYEVQDRMNALLPQISEVEDLSSAEKKSLLAEAKKSLQCQLKRWKPIDYSEPYQCILYLLSRLAIDYAAIMKVYSEILFFLPSFKPKSFFDFGSGVGSAIWASHSTWGESISEYFCVDTSAEMNELCGRLLEDEETQEKILKTVFFRQFLPASDKIRYDLAISAFSLLELPSQVDRLRTVDTLWRKTTDILVLIEPGTISGFSAILDARDYILKLESSDANPFRTGAYVLAPCPHESTCPRTEETTFSPCTSYASYYPLFPKKSVSKKQLFSYVVLRRGPRPEDHLLWPRVVKPIIKSHKHLHCHLCCSDGKIHATILTKCRHGRNAYRCARTSEIGDLLPISLSTPLKDSLDSPEDNLEDSDDSDNESKLK